MKSKKPTPEELAALCDEIGPEDGGDPRDLKKSFRVSDSRRQDFQLCKQVEDTLNLELVGDGLHPILAALMIWRVEPAPNSRHLLVVVSPSDPEADLDEAKVLEALGEEAERLRIAVANSIHRKRVPELSFRYLPPRVD